MTVFTTEGMHKKINDHISKYLNRVAVVVKNTVFVPSSFTKIFEVKITESEVISIISR